MFGEELFGILAVFERLQEFITDQVDLVDIVLSCRRFELINGEGYYNLLRKYSVKTSDRAERIRLFYELMLNIIPMTSLATFKWIISDAGYHQISREIVLQLNGNIHAMPSKRSLPHSEILTRYFSNLKRCADSKSFQDGTVFQLKSLINSLNTKIQKCPDNQGKLQLLVDKRVLAYFLLAQQYSDMDERMAVMKRMRKSISGQNIDTGLFETIFHSYMMVIWSIKGDLRAADMHEQRARCVDFMCLPGVVSLILRFCIQYKSDIALFRRRRNEDFKRASTDFNEIFRNFHFIEKDAEFYSSIAMLEIVHTLVGIDWNLEVSSVHKQNEYEVEYAEHILSSFAEPEEPRRQMLYFLCKARILETRNLQEAERFAGNAFAHASEGTYYDIEKQNIENYINRLRFSQKLPQPTSNLLA